MVSSAMIFSVWLSAIHAFAILSVPVSSDEYSDLMNIPDVPVYHATCNSSSSISPDIKSPPYTRVFGGCLCPTASTRPWPSDCVFPEGKVFNDSSDSPSERLLRVLDAQPEMIWKERYRWRHPYQTLKFFGVEPGMVVVEADPGGLWYSRILKDYLGYGGKLIGMDYPPPFGMAGAWGYDNFTTGFPARLHHHFGTSGASLGAFQSNYMPESMHGTADVVLLIRILHDFPYFQKLLGFPWRPVLGTFLADCYLVLKPNGWVGVVDHDAGTRQPEAWIYNGYLSTKFVLMQMQQAGFRLKAASNINENVKDLPGQNDTVWRLAPTFNAGISAAISIGESNRLTLIFDKLDL